MSMIFGVFFEANAIQQYILAGGRLRDIVGASYLIDSLGGDVLDAVCQQQGLTPPASPDPPLIRFPRRAAGAIYALFTDEQKAGNFAALWSLVVRAHCPTLSFNQVMASGDTDFAVLQAGTNQLAHARAFPVADFPPATPVTERAPRTGRAQIGASKLGPNKSVEPVDTALASRRSVTPDAVQAMDDRLLSAAAKLSLCVSLNLKNVFPRNLEFTDPEDDVDATPRWQFPFKPDSRYLAMIHADGNGFGQILLNVIADAAEAAKLNQSGTNSTKADDYGKFLPQLSGAVATCTRQAVQQAIQTVLVPHGAEATTKKESLWRLPARPIVIAGDDLTMIVRADLALSFTSHFICEFERLTACQFAALQVAFPNLGKLLPKAGLTACAGIAYARNNQPFAMLHEVAEELCGQAKQQVKQLAKEKDEIFAGSAIAFRRITESLMGAETSAELGGVKVLPRLGALAVGNTNHGLPTVPSLENLLAVLKPVAIQTDDAIGDKDDPMSKGPLRRILNIVFLQPKDASTDYKRWKTLALSQTGPDQTAAFSAALKKLAGAAGGSEWDELPAIVWPPPAAGEPKLARLVLQELIDLLAVGHQPVPMEAKGVIQ